MEIKVIKTQQEYEAALGELESLVERDPDENTPEANRLEVLGLLVEKYESEEFPIGLPDPIEAIKFRMEQKQLTPRDLIPFFGSRSKVSEVLSGKRPLTLSMIRALSKGLGIPANVLLQESSATTLDRADIDWSKFPLREMFKRNYFDANLSDLQERGQELLRAFVGNVGPQVNYALLPKRTNYVRSARPTDQYSLTAWAIRIITLSNENLPTEEFSQGTVDLDFMRQVARLSSYSDGPKRAIEFLWKHGISVVVERHLSRTYLDGAAILIYSHRPIIGLTLRHDRIDNFWFCLEHELAHISRHSTGEATEFYDDLDVDNQGDQREQEADRLAGEALIPEDEWRKSPASRSPIPEAVNDLATKLGIHPAIVAGRYRHQYKAFRILRDMVGNGEVRCQFPNVDWSD